MAVLSLEVRADRPRPRPRKRSRQAALTAIVAGMALSLIAGGDAPLRASDEAASPAVLTAADLDEDGVLDLLSGVGAGEGGVITVHRGNVDAIYPNAPAARARKSAGAFTSAPFLPARRFGVNARPEALHSADVDGDGHIDVIAATAGGDAVVLRGDGTGSLGAARALPLPADASQALKPLAADLLAAALSAPPATVLLMRLDADGRMDLVTMPAGAAMPTVVTTLDTAVTQVVTNTNDSGPGSLREAILAANATEGDDVITFDIPGPGPHVITPATPLPPIAPDDLASEGSVLIDGTTEPDFAGTPIVELSGALVGASGPGLTIASPRSVVRGLVINRFSIGVFVTASIGPGSQDEIVEGNYIGTDVTGTVALGNGRGVGLGSGGTDDQVFHTTVGGTAPAARNLISGNGVGILGGGPRHVIQGNYIGTDADGTGPLGNTARGIELLTADGAEVGGSSPGAGNVISANGSDGVMFFETGNMQVVGNYIGTDAAGSGALGNGGHGVEATDIIGAITDNLISGNSGNGINANPIAILTIQNNRIGTNAAGTESLGNLGSGIDGTGSSNQPTRGNLVSGNGSHGIVVKGLENRIEDNLIGTDISGTGALGNRGDGIRVLDMVNTIGGDGVGNVIAFNGGGGVVVDLDFTTFVGVVSNSIHSNGGLGIDLGNDGVTANDACDPENDGVNDFPNFPVLTGATSSASSTTVMGHLNSLPNASFRLQFFSSPAPDPSGFGEGAQPLGSTTVTTDAACNASFSITLPAPVSAGHVVTATTTYTNDFGQSGTSEFSNAVPVAGSPSTEDDIRALMAQVQALVDNGDLTSQAGQALTARLRTALSLLEKGKPPQAAQQLRVFINQVTVLVNTGRLDPPLGQALIDAANAIIADLETS